MCQTEVMLGTNCTSQSQSRALGHKSWFVSGLGIVCNVPCSCAYLSTLEHLSGGLASAEPITSVLTARKKEVC